METFLEHFWENYFLTFFGAGWGTTRVRIKGGNCEGGNWDLVDLVDLVNLFNSAEIYKNIRRNKETIGAAFGRAPQGRGAPLWLVSWFSLCFCIFQLNWINWLNLLNQLNPNYPLRNYTLLSLPESFRPRCLICAPHQKSAESLLGCLLRVLKRHLAFRV